MSGIRVKLDEAAFFHDKLTGGKEDKRTFRCYLSAFLAASRSVMQYTWQQAKGTSSQAWYQQWAEQDPIAFFKCKRDFEIHRKPVVPRRNITEELGQVIFISDSLKLQYLDKNGQMIEEYESPMPKEDGRTSPPSTGQAFVQYFFTDRPGDKVCDLCGQYLSQLRRIVDEGLQQGHIKP